MIFNDINFIIIDFKKRWKFKDSNDSFIETVHLQYSVTGTVNAL